MMALTLLPVFSLMQPRMWFCNPLLCKDMLFTLVQIVVYKNSPVVVETELSPSSSLHPVCTILEGYSGLGSGLNVSWMRLKVV